MINTKKKEAGNFQGICLSSQEFWYKNNIVFVPYEPDHLNILPQINTLSGHKTKS